MVVYSFIKQICGHLLLSFTLALSNLPYKLYCWLNEIIIIFRFFCGVSEMAVRVRFLFQVHNHIFAFADYEAMWHFTWTFCAFLLVWHSKDVNVFVTPTLGWLTDSFESIYRKSSQNEFFTKVRIFLRLRSFISMVFSMCHLSLNCNRKCRNVAIALQFHLRWQVLL